MLTQYEKILKELKEQFDLESDLLKNTSGTNYRDHLKNMNIIEEKIKDIEKKIEGIKSSNDVPKKENELLGANQLNAVVEKGSIVQVKDFPYWIKGKERKNYVCKPNDTVTVVNTYMFGKNDEKKRFRHLPVVEKNKDNFEYAVGIISLRDIKKNTQRILKNPFLRVSEIMTSSIATVTFSSFVKDVISNYFLREIVKEDNKIGFISSVLVVENSQFKGILTFVDILKHWRKIVKPDYLAELEGKKISEIGFRNLADFHTLDLNCDISSAYFFIENTEFRTIPVIEEVSNPSLSDEKLFVLKIMLSDFLIYQQYPRSGNISDLYNFDITDNKGVIFENSSFGDVVEALAKEEEKSAIPIFKAIGGKQYITGVVDYKDILRHILNHA